MRLHEVLDREAFLARLKALGMSEADYWTDLRVSDEAAAARALRPPERTRPSGGLADNDSFGGNPPDPASD